MTVAPLRRVFSIVNGGTPTAEDENWGGDVAWATPVDLAVRHGSTIGMTSRTLTVRGLRTGSALVPAASLIVSTRAPIGYVAETEAPMAFNQGCRGLVPRQRVDLRFFRYQLSALTLELQSRGQGSTFAELSTGALGSVPIVVPNLSEQRAIADYLDAETARIDHALGALRRSVVLVHERRRSLISEVFAEPLRTGRGTTVRAIADPLLGRQRSPEHASGPYMVRYLRAANVKDGRLALDDVMEMNFTPAEQQIFALQPGDVLITEGAGSLAAVGANAVWRGELNGMICFQNTLIRLRPAPGSEPRYVAWWARFAYESGMFRSAAGGANIYHLGVETIRALPAWAPEASVQALIAARLDLEIGKMDQQVRLRERLIDLLLERRQALITAAVTGQLGIPGVAA